jgi:hypothetical protein
MPATSKTSGSPTSDILIRRRAMQDGYLQALQGPLSRSISDRSAVPKMESLQELSHPHNGD